MKKILVLLLLVFQCSYVFSSEIQRNIDTRYKDLLRRQEMENRTKFIKEEESKPGLGESVPPSNNTKQFDKIDIIRSDVPHIYQRHIRKILKPYKDNILGMNEIAAIQEQLQSLYMYEGYAAARVYIDGNTMPQNILTFVVMDGYIEDIVFHTAKGKKYSKFASALQRFSFYPFSRNALLNMKDIDQGLEQMNRLSSGNASMEILPGTKDGYSVINITNDVSKRFWISLSADNSGLENTGYYKTNAAINADNLLMLNDNIYFNYSRNIDGNWDHKANNSYFASLSIPLGYLTLMTSFFKSDYITPAGTSIGRYTSDGSTQNENVSLEAVIKRAQSHKVSAGAEMALKETENFVAGQKVGVSSKNLTVASVFLSATYYLNTSMIYGKLSYNQGLDWFDAVLNSGIPYTPQGQFYSLSLYAQYSQLFMIPFIKLASSYMLAVNGQQSPDILYGSEQITLGGQSSVRGFKEGSVAGESGLYVRNDLNWKLSDIFRRAGWLNIFTGTTLNAFIDYGYARNEEYGQDYQLAGSGAGLSYRIKYFNASAVWSRAVYNESYLKDEGDVFYLSVEAKVYF